MGTPELFLNSLNKSLKRLLVSSSLLDDQNLEENIKQLYKKTSISELFFNRYLIAISGLQGAGKTNLIKQIYDLPENILKPNPGRGEKIPVLITEWEGHEYKFYKKVIIKENDDVLIKDEEIDNADNFNKEASDPSINLIYLELKVPYKFFNSSEKSFVLLPGIEDSKHEEEYQTILMHSLISSATCIFLFDEIRYNNYINKVTLEKIKEIFSESKPIFILTKSDTSKDDNTELYNNFKKDFPNTEEDRIVISGDGETYRNIWLPKLMDALQKYRSVEPSFRRKQIENINKLLRDDLGDIISSFEEEKLLSDYKSDKLEDDVNNYMKILKKHVDKIKVDFTKSLKNVLNDQRNVVMKKIKESLYNRGFLRPVVDFFTRDVRKRREMEQLIAAAWAGSGGNDLSTIIKKALAYSQTKAGFIKASTQITSQKNFMPENYNETKFEIDNDIVTDMKKLVDMNDDPKNIEFSLKFERFFELLPIFVLESVRIFIQLPKLYNVNESDMSITMRKNVDGVLNDFDYLLNKPSKVCNGIAFALGIDGAVDGKLDTIPNLMHAITGAAAGSFAMEIATAAGYVFIAVSLYKSILNQIDKSDLRNEIGAQNVVTQIIEHFNINALEYFDKIMEIMYEQVSRLFRNRYNLSENFTRHETLIKALADVKTNRAKFREYILEGCVN